MATTTTNFGWDIPQSTDLVKDGATAIAALGQDIDTALVDLKGGTTGQVLAKASGTDLDFSWVAQDDSNAIQNAIVDAKGDLIAATANDTPARLAVGANDTVLTADSSTATGLKWATPASGGGMTLLNSGGTSLSGASTTVSFTSTGYINLQIQIKNAYLNGDQNGFSLRVNGDTGSNYSSMRYMNYGTTPNVEGSNQITQTDIILANRLGSASSPPYKVGSVVLNIFRPTDTDYFFLTWDSSGTNANVANTWYVKGTGIYDGSAAISSITILAAAGSFSGGTIYVYGVK